MFDTIYAFELPLTARLHRYWQARRGRATLPSLDAIDPAALPFALGESLCRALALIDVVRDGDDPAAESVRFRFASCGASLAPWHGDDMTGRWLDRHPDPEFAARLDWAWRRVLAGRAPLHGRRTGRIAGRRREYEYLVLPIGNAEGRVGHLLSLHLDLPAPAMPRPAEPPLRKSA